MKRVFDFAIFAFALLLAGRVSFGQTSSAIPNLGLADISEAAYKSLTAQGRKDLVPGDPILRVLPGVGRLRWIVENKTVLHPKVQSFGAYRWAWLELSISNATKSSAKAAAGQRFEAVRVALEQSGAVLHMQPIQTATISQAQVSAAMPEPNDPYFGQQKAMIDLVNIRPLWQLDVTSPKAMSMSKVAIAIMDTGLRCSHPDLSAVVDAANSRSFVDTPCDPTAPHGTQVAGVAAAVANNGIGIAGVSQGVPILDWEIFRWGTDINGKKVLYTDDEIMLRALTSILSLPYERVVVNASIQETDPYDPGKFWSRTLRMLEDKALIVGNAGNEGVNTSERDVYPGTLSSLTNVICLAAIGSQGKFAGFSGFGDKVEITAPGVNVFTTDDSAEGYISSVSGVSFSVPQAAGIAAMLAKHAAQLPSPADLKQALLKGASLNLNLVGLMPQPRQLNGGRAWLAITGQLGNEPALATRFDRYDDGNGNDVFSPAPYSWVVIWGKQLADGYYNAGTLPLPTSLGGVRVLLDGQFPLPLLSISPERIDVQMLGDFVMAPLPGVRHSLTLVRVDRDGNPIVGSQVILPKFETISTRPAVRMLTDENGQMVWDQNPARVGETLRVVVSGLGRTTPVVQPGVPFMGIERPEAEVKLFINDNEVVGVETKAIPFAVGLFEIKFRLPLPSTPYNAKVTLCAGNICTDQWFNHDGGGR